jgi:hypothetical protein
MDGDHYSVDEDDQPAERLYLDPEAGTYRYATDEDPSYHERFHQNFVDVIMEDGQPGARVTPEEFAEIQKLLGQMRGGE